MATGAVNGDLPAAINGHIGSHALQDTRPAPAPPTTAPLKKGKQAKKMEPTEASKLVAQKIAQLELGKAEEKDQEVEIGGFPPDMGCLFSAGLILDTPLDGDHRD